MNKKFQEKLEIRRMEEGKQWRVGKGVQTIMFMNYLMNQL